MGKLLKTKDILLLGLANLLDFSEEVRDPFHLLSHSYKNMYGWVPKQYHKHNFYQLISRSYKAKFIEKVEKDGKIYIRITSEGKKTIQRDFPMLSLQNKKWDGKWRIVMFDVDEINKQTRNRLRSKLKELGFGMLQKSVFISPHDILQDFIEFSESSEIEDYLYILETHKLTVRNEQEFANRVWKLRELNEKYKSVVDEISEVENRHIISDNDRTKISDIPGEEKRWGGKLKDIKVDDTKGSIKTNIANIKNRWLKIVFGDPFLPKIFLPKPWYGDKAEKLVRGLAL